MKILIFLGRHHFPIVSYSFLILRQRNFALGNAPSRETKGVEHRPGISGRSGATERCDLPLLVDDYSNSNRILTMKIGGYY